MVGAVVVVDAEPVELALLVPTAALLTVKVTAEPGVQPVAVYVIGAPGTGADVLEVTRTDGWPYAAWVTAGAANSTAPPMISPKSFFILSSVTSGCLNVPR